MNTKATFAILGLSLMLFTPPARPQAEPGSLKELRRWVSKYPYEEIDGRQFWQVEALRAALRDAFSPDDFKTFAKTKGPMTKVEASGPYLLTSVCQAHDCGDHNYQVFVDVGRDRVWVCHRVVLSADSVRADWWASGQRTATGEECEPELDDNGEQTLKARLAMIPRSLR